MRNLKAKHLLEEYYIKFQDDSSDMYFFRANILYRSGYWLEAEIELKNIISKSKSI